MGVKTKDDSKVVIKNAGNTYLDVRIVHKKDGYGKDRKTKKSFYDVFHSKHRVTIEEFNKPELGVEFIEKYFPKYNKKEKKFKFK